MRWMSLAEEHKVDVDGREERGRLVQSSHSSRLGTVSGPQGYEARGRVCATKVGQSRLRASWASKHRRSAAAEAEVVGFEGRGGGGDWSVRDALIVGDGHGDSCGGEIGSAEALRSMAAACRSRQLRGHRDRGRWWRASCVRQRSREHGSGGAERRRERRGGGCALCGRRPEAVAAARPSKRRAGGERR